MKTPIVPIGNSKGVRVPRALLEHCRMEGEVELSVKGGVIVICPLRSRPRAGWEAAFKAMGSGHAGGMIGQAMCAPCSSLRPVRMLSMNTEYAIVSMKR